MNLVDLKTELKMVCPFRTKTIMMQTETHAEQLVEYPECQYAQCPMYDPKGKTVMEKCIRVLVMNQGVIE